MKTCLTYAEVLDTLMNQTEKRITITNVFGATPDNVAESGLRPDEVIGYWQIEYTDWNTRLN